jgi:hypothetical protein
MLIWHARSHEPHSVRSHSQYLVTKLALTQGPYRDPAVMVFVHELEICWSPSCANTAPSFRKILTVLADPPNVQVPTLKRPRDHPSPSLSTPFRDGLRALGPRLTRLDIRIDMAHILDLVALDPWAVNLEALGLVFGGRGLAQYDLDGIVPALIAPVRASLRELKLHFAVPTSSFVHKHPIATRPLSIGAVFAALAALSFPDLHSLSVLSPFRGRLTEDEEAPLVQFIQSHALRTLVVAPSRTYTHSSYGGTSRGLSRAYAHLFELASKTPRCGGHLHELTVSVLGTHDWAAFLDFLGMVDSPLEALALEGRILDISEFTQLMRTLRGASQMLCSLHLKLERLAPSNLQLLAEACPRLQHLHVYAKDHSRTEVLSLGADVVPYQDTTLAKVSAELEA